MWHILHTVHVHFNRVCRLCDHQMGGFAHHAGQVTIFHLPILTADMCTIVLIESVTVQIVPHSVTPRKIAVQSIWREFFHDCLQDKFLII